MKLFDGKLVIFTGEYNACDIQRFKDEERKKNVFYQSFGTIDNFDPAVQRRLLEHILEIAGGQNIILGTNSIYILNYLNLMIAYAQYPENEPKDKEWFGIDPDDSSIKLVIRKNAVPEIEELVQDDESEKFVNTLHFTEIIEDCYAEYESVVDPDVEVD